MHKKVQAEVKGTNIQVVGAHYAEDITDKMHLINCRVKKHMGEWRYTSLFWLSDSEDGAPSAYWTEDLTYASCKDLDLIKFQVFYTQHKH
jgi:hypothetical protein